MLSNTLSPDGDPREEYPVAKLILLATLLRASSLGLRAVFLRGANCLSKLRDIDLQSLRSLRLVSRRFDAIAMPIVYRNLTLNERLVAQNAEIRYPTAFQHIAFHTNHVVISSDLNPEGITRVLLRIQRLTSVRWLYIGDTFDTASIWVPSDVLNLELARFRNTKLHVENLPLQEFNGHLHDAYTRAIPGRLLASLKLAGPSPALTARLGSLKHLLLQSPRLQTLHYEDRGQGTSFVLGSNERMPAITNLRMRSYNWNHTGEDVRRHWDFSRIESLELVSVPLYNFLASVPFDDFWNLHALRVEDYSAHLPDRRHEATGGLYLLVKNYIQALEVLDITCHTEIFLLDAILAHNHSLRVFRFRDHVGFCEDNRKCPTLFVGDVAVLAGNLRYVHTLELDMDVRHCNPFQFLRAISDFPALHTLTLNVQTLVNPFEFIPPGIDCDYDAATQAFDFLVQIKKQTTPQLSFKCITIKVGGWKPVMVRRLGSEWREHNENGIFAERCFIMERELNGRFEVREEMGFETLSRRSTPSP
ncbi:Fc.00g035840.m01.CDS01 [Cosmosporella sp. VM-42]